MSSIDQKIQELFAKLNARKSKVDGLRKEIAKTWKTNGTFRLIGAGTPTNIQTASAETIEEMAAHLCLLDGARTAASVRLAREIELKVQGFTVDEWFDDLLKRLATINLREEEKQLDALEKRLNQVLSPEERRRIEVELLVQEIE